MASQQLEAVVRAINALPEEEIETLRGILNAGSVEASPAEMLHQLLIEKGLISVPPANQAAVDRHRERVLVPCSGKPVSETIIEERR